MTALKRVKPLLNILSLRHMCLELLLSLDQGAPSMNFTELLVPNFQELPRIDPLLKLHRQCLHSSLLVDSYILGEPVSEGCAKSELNHPLLERKGHSLIFLSA